MVEFDEAGPPEVYPLVSVRLKRHIKRRNKKYISLIIFGCSLLLVTTIIFTLTVFKSFYHEKQITTPMTKTIAFLTTVSTLSTEVSMIFNNAQCPASNCPHGATCCLTNKMWTNMRCCRSNTPVCCSPDQGWCCRIHAPVCCGKFGCCPLNTTCCTSQGVEQCCPITVNNFNTTISTTVE